MSAIVGVYAITCRPTGRVYVGSSQHIANRWKVHRHLLRHGKHTSPALQNAWDKHGEAAFEFAVIQECGIDQLLGLEQAHIDRLGCVTPAGFNVCQVTGTRRGVPQPPHVGEIVSARHKGQPKSAEHRAKISAARMGQRKSAAHKARLAEAAQRQFSDPTARAKAAEYGARSRGGRGRIINS